MRLELHAEGSRNKDTKMMQIAIPRTMMENIKVPLHKRIIYGITPVLLFPFEFIIICLYIIMLPFITMAALIGAKFVLRGLDEK